jgi:heme/copper-type cytochrome/quinol oxidase subunit 2
MPLPLADAIFWVAVVCCAIAQWFILRGALAAHPAAGAPMSPARRGLEVVWAVLPAVALAVVLAATWRALHPAPSAPPAPAGAPAAAVPA